MRLTSLFIDDKPNLFWVTDNTYYALSQDGEALLPDLLLNDQKEVVRAIDKAEKTPINSDHLHYAPLLTPQKLIGVGLNYRKHAEELGFEIPEHPVYFAKFSNSLAAHQQVLPLDNIPTLDYECELAVVIGAEAKDIMVENAIDYVLGYTCANDLSSRVRQGRGPQWTLGKAFDFSLPLGPYLVTKEDLPNPQDLSLSTRLNGKIVQMESTSDMIFSVAEIVSDLSHHMTLSPGDTIFTGTPHGVIVGLPKPRNWLKKGDVVEVEISDIGVLKNWIG